MPSNEPVDDLVVRVLARLRESGADRAASFPAAWKADDSLAPCIDHTLLRPDAVSSDIELLCEEAAGYGFASACINSVWVAKAARILEGSGVHVCSVVGFPLGANTTEVKVFEARRAISDGAREIDMVMNIGVLKSGWEEPVAEDLGRVVEVCSEGGAICKIILETGLLTEKEKILACRLAVASGAAFVKTSTGFGPGGATLEDVALMSRAVGPALGVKAAGGIGRASEVRAMMRAGASRIGASAGVAILEGKS